MIPNDSGWESILLKLVRRRVLNSVLGMSEWLVICPPLFNITIIDKVVALYAIAENQQKLLKMWLWLLITSNI